MNHQTPMASEGGGKIGPDVVWGGKEVTVGSENTDGEGLKARLRGQEEGRGTLMVLLFEVSDLVYRESFLLTFLYRFRRLQRASNLTGLFTRSAAGIICSSILKFPNLFTLCIGILILAGSAIFIHLQ